MLKSWSAAKKCPLGQRLRGCCQPAGRPRQLSSVIVPTTGHGLEQGCSPVNLARRSGCRPEACKTNCFRTQVGQVFVQKKQKTKASALPKKETPEGLLSCHYPHSTAPLQEQEEVESTLRKDHSAAPELIACHFLAAPPRGCRQHSALAWLGYRSSPLASPSPIAGGPHQSAGVGLGAGLLCHYRLREQGARR